MHARAWSRLLTAALAATVGLVAPAASAVPERSGLDGTVPTSPNGRYLVQYAPSADVATESRDLRAGGVIVRRTFAGSFKVAVVRASRAEAANLLRDPAVLAVEPDVRITASQTQSDPPWGLDRVDQRALPLSKSYSAPASGEGVTVYVMDTGVLAAHTELAGRVTEGWTAFADGHGTSDCDGHGTHVAGTVAGTTTGVAKSAVVVPVRVLGCDGSGWTSDLIAGLDWIIGQHAAGSPAVVNMSLGTGRIVSTLDAAVEAVVADGLTAVVAAGNESADACGTSPARVPGVLTVAASDSKDSQASFSNFGACVDLYAPGRGITSAAVSSLTDLISYSGTSMAAPHVAGAAAVLLSQQPSLTPTQVTARLNSDATPDVISGASAGTPNRLLHLAPASETAPAPELSETQPTPISSPEQTPEVTVPGRAARPQAAARRRAAVVRWVQGDDGGSEITGQIVRVYRGTKRVGTLKIPGDVTGIRVKGLRPGKVYRFTVTARNALGRSPESAKSNRVRPRR